MSEAPPAWFSNFVAAQDARMAEASAVVSALSDDVQGVSARLVAAEQQQIADRHSKAVKLLPPSLADPNCWAVCDEYHVLCSSSVEIAALRGHAEAHLRHEASLANTKSSVLEGFVQEANRAFAIMLPILSSPTTLRSSREALTAYRAWRNLVAYLGAKIRFGNTEALTHYDELQGVGGSKDHTEARANMLKRVAASAKPKGKAAENPEN